MSPTVVLTYFHIVVFIPLFFPYKDVLGFGFVVHFLGSTFMYTYSYFLIGLGSVVLCTIGGCLVRHTLSSNSRSTKLIYNIFRTISSMPKKPPGYSPTQNIVINSDYQAVVTALL